MSSSAIRARILADSHHSRREPIIHGTATADGIGGYGSVAEAEMNEGDKRLDHQTQHHGGNDRFLQTNSSTLSSNYDDGNTHHEHHNGDDDDYDDDDSATNDSSDASSLDEDDVREVVKQVMMMVKHNRRSTSTAASQSNGRTQSSVDSTQHPPTGGGTATRLSSLETTARTSVSLSLSQQSHTQLVPSQHNPKLAAALAALANGSPTISVPASSRFSRNGGGAKELKSANVSTYASRVGITTTTTTTINPAAVAAASVVSGATLSPRTHNNTFGERQPDATAAAGEERPSSAIRFSRRPTDEEDDVIHMRGRPSARATPGKPRMLFGGQQQQQLLSPNHLSRQFLVSPAKAPHDDGGTTRGRRAAAPQLSRSASDSSRLQRAANHHHAITPAQQRAAANDPCDTSTVSNMTYVEQRRIERMIMQRNEALREETFTPRTSLQRDGVVSEVPENIRNIPTRGPGHWEDRLYNEYLSRKKHKELENEALRIAKEAHKELTDALDECSFTPDLAAIHDHMRHWKKDSPAFTQGGGAAAAGGTATGCVNSRSSSAVGLSKRDRAAMVTERLYKPPLLTAATLQGDSVLTGQPPPPIHPEDMKPSETQQRLYEEHKKRQQEKQRLLDAKLKELNISSFVFQIKGNYYETLPFPQHADPGSFERLYKEGQKRQAKRTQQQEEALARRPSPVPEISEYARRRGRSAQPAFERLSVVKKNNVASANNNNGDNAGGGIVNPNARSSSPPLCSSPTPQDATVRNLMSSRPRALSIADPFSSIPMLNISQVYGGGGGGGVDGSSHNATPLQRSFTAAGFNNGGVGAASEHILNWVNNTTTTTTNLHHQQHQASSQYGTHLSALHPLSHHHNNSTTASAVVSAAVSRQESLNHNYQFHHHNNNQLSAGHPHHNIVPGATGLQRSSFLTGARSPVMLTVLSPCAPGESGGFPQQQDAQQLSGAENRSDGVLTAVGAAPPMRLQPVGGAQLQPVATPPPALVSALIDEDASGNYILTARTSYYSAVNDGPSPMDSAPDSLDKTTRPPPALVPKDDAPAGRMPNTTMSVAHHQQPQRQSSSPSSSSRQLKERAAGSPGGMSPSVMLFEKYVEVSSESGSSAAPSTPRRRRSQGFGGGRRRSSAIVLAVDEPESAVEEVVEEDDLAFVLAN